MACREIRREITDATAREREIARVEQRARFGELAAGLAHEIKNPLAGIQGAVDILISRRDDNDPERTILEGVKHEVGRIDRTVQMLLDRARPRTLNIRPASVSEAAERAMSFAMVSLAPERKEQIQFNLDVGTIPIVMPIDAVQIEDAILNLLLNAVDAIDGEGSITVRVYERRPHASTDEVAIDVIDSGRGIAENELQNIFSPFYTTHPAGTGLGLPAVRGIARAHGGRVEVSSIVNKGTTFSIRLPRNPLRAHP